MTTSLAARHVHETADTLRRRVGERFPESGLLKVAAEVARAAKSAERRSLEIARPNWPLRVVTWTLVTALVAGIPAAILNFRTGLGFKTLFDLIQGVEAAANLTVLLGAAILSTARLEAHLRRRAALRLLNELKALAHVIDMHQLTKDPELLLAAGPATPSSPKRTMTPFELGRYLDYCSELLSLIGKIAALYGQRIQDAEVLEAVDSTEDLSTGLSLKLWQKIAILSERQRGAAA